MKTFQFFSLVFFLLSILFVSGQEFAPVGAKWYYSEHNGGASPSDAEYVLYKSTKDTTMIVNNEQFTLKKIERTYYRYSGDTSYLTPYFIAQMGDTVYLFNPDSSRLDKLYIFNVQKGDTISLGIPYDQLKTQEMSTFRLVIDSVTIETYNGTALKKYFIKGIDSYGWLSNWYMDRTGSQDWFTPRGAIIPEAGGPLRCYHDSEVDIQLVSFDCDYRLISGLQPQQQAELIAYPNPTTGNIYINTNKVIEVIEVYNTAGQLLKTVRTKAVDISGYPKDTYILRIKTNNTYYIKEVIKL